jgi:membrane associated rhomboid family serine protease
MDETKDSQEQTGIDSVPEPLSNVPDSVPPPEDFFPTPPKMPGPFKRWPAQRELLLAALFALACLVVSLLSWNSETDLVTASGRLVYGRGEVWRLFTALLAHGDLSHFGFNVLPLLFFGWMLKAYFGPVAFPFAPLLVGIASNAITIALYPPATHLLGASGMIFGMIAMWLLLYIRFDTENRFTHKAGRVLGFILMLLLPHTYEPDVSYLAHASGFILGLAVGVMMLPWVKLREPPAVEPQPPSRRYYRIVRVRRRPYWREDDSEPRV